MSDTAGLRVLVVDGDHGLKRALHSAFTEFFGWTVLTASDPLEAQKHYGAVDVVITDWSMAHGGGARVLAEARCPVLVYSADHADMTHPHSLRKPASLPTIQMALLQAVGKKHEWSFET